MTGNTQNKVLELNFDVLEVFIIVCLTYGFFSNLWLICDRLKWKSGFKFCSVISVSSLLGYCFLLRSSELPFIQCIFCHPVVASIKVFIIKYTFFTVIMFASGIFLVLMSLYVIPSCKKEYRSLAKVFIALITICLSIIIYNYCHLLDDVGVDTMFILGKVSSIFTNYFSIILISVSLFFIFSGILHYLFDLLDPNYTWKPSNHVVFLLINLWISPPLLHYLMLVPKIRTFLVGIESQLKVFYYIIPICVLVLSVSGTIAWMRHIINKNIKTRSYRETVLPSGKMSVFYGLLFAVCIMVLLAVTSTVFILDYVLAIHSLTSGNKTSQVETTQPPSWSPEPLTRISPLTNHSPPSKSKLPIPSKSPFNTDPSPSTSPLTDHPSPSKSPLTDRPLPSRAPLTDRPSPSRPPLTDHPPSSRSSLTDHPSPSKSSLTNHPSPSMSPLTDHPSPSRSHLTNHPSHSRSPLTHHPPPSKSPLTNHPPPSRLPLTDHPPPSRSPLTDHPSHSRSPLTHHPPPSKSSLTNHPSPLTEHPPLSKCMKVDRDSRHVMTLQHMSILHYGKEKDLRIIEKVAPHWRELARIFDFDERMIAGNYNNGVEFSGNCCYDVLRKWFQRGAPGYPLTWNGLIHALRDIKLYELITDLEMALECIHDIHSPAR